MKLRRPRSRGRGAGRSACGPRRDDRFAVPERLTASEGKKGGM